MKLWMDLRDRLTGLDLWLEQSTLLLAVRRGFTLIIPFLLIGSFALIVTSLPVPAYQRLMITLFGLQAVRRPEPHAPAAYALLPRWRRRRLQ